MNISFQEKRELAYQIVDFWHTVELLDQDPFPQDSRENRKLVELAKKGSQGTGLDKGKERKITKFQLFHNLPLKPSIADLIEADTLMYPGHPVSSSVIHLCVGRMEREFLIDALYRGLQLQDDIPEKDTSEICLIGLKVNQEGINIEHSFRLSPLVWGIRQILSVGDNAGGSLSSRHYEEEMRGFDEKFSKTEPLKSENIEELYLEIFEQYVRPICQSAEEPVLKGNLIYTRYNNSETFMKEEEKAEDVSELVKGFYSEDLHMVKESLLTIEKETSMHADLIDYIVGAYLEQYGQGKEIGTESRVDIRNDRTHIEKWLYADKAPSGKWPSRYNPVLMQQLAINMGISEIGGVRRIFSVNGPPGTGKTTLLKEIIASNIVERAVMLCEYEHADDAFEARHFKHGTFVNNGYDQYCNKYYVLKNERLTDFNMLVASCNNAAVENITKDLPNGPGLLENLQSNVKDSKDVAKGLAEVSALFDCSRNGKKERYKVFRTAGEGKGRYEAAEKGEVYFSWPAHKLMLSSEEVEDTESLNAWGLISAPMGKASNINKYYYNVLRDIIEQFLSKNEWIKKRQNGFTQAKVEFKTQWNKVSQLKQELADNSRLSDIYREKKQKHEELLQEYQAQIGGIRKGLQENHLRVHNLAAEESATRKNIAAVQQKLAGQQIHIQDKNHQSSLLQEQIETIQKHLVEREDERKLIEIWFGWLIKTERLRQIQELKDQREEIKQEQERIRESLQKMDREYGKEEAVLADYEDTLKLLFVQIEKEKNEIRESERQVQVLNEQMGDIRCGIEKNRLELQAELSALGRNMNVLDDKYWENFGSSQLERNTRAQLSNPWITDEYNREREKLFYHALQVHKEFILSSKSCRFNFINLSMMWKYRENSQNELVQFSLDDRNDSFPHLLNTLFLLTPVLSTTFASVGRFLRYNRVQGSMGLLIIDEAGQAAPHVALGALWRSKKAIVVGDPKQVEPVVTADSDAIKKVLSNKLLLPYLNKSLSVQNFADRINIYGSYITDRITNETKWVGCPLIVHRRCTDPMFTISNTLSYDGTMKLQTAAAKEEDKRKFVLKESCWIDVGGFEIGNKNHFVPEQGKVALDLIIQSFRNYNGLPDLYVISPFTTVIQGVRGMVRGANELANYKDEVETWLEQYCGTVHKFQGKEAKEVILLLGCDARAEGAVRWVKPNIVNVAATRAKYRFYILGEYSVWRKSQIFEITKNIIEPGK